MGQRPASYLVKYGYRIGEVNTPACPALKDDVRITRPDVSDDFKRRVAEAGLGAECVGVCYPHPDMAHSLSGVVGVRMRMGRLPPDALPFVVPFDCGLDRDVLRKLSGDHESRTPLEIVPDRGVSGIISRAGLAKYVRGRLGMFERIPSTYDFSTEAWLEKTHYPKWRKEQLRKISEEVKLNFHLRYSARMTFNKCFIKDESYPTYKFPRGIYSRVDHAKVILGPIFKAMEEIVYQHPSFIKHIPVAGRAKYINDKIGKPGLRYMATDYTAFESHFTKDTMEMIEFQVYEHLLCEVPEGREFMNYIRTVIGGENVCRFKYFKAIIQACRMSGEMNTSLGNGLANFFMYQYIHESLGNRDFDCVIEGDDALGCFRGITPTAEMYAALGFTIKIEIHDKVSTASFCGLIFDQDDLVSVVDPMKLLLNVGWISAKYRSAGTKKRLALLRGKALCMLHQYAGVPVVQSLALYLLRATEGSKFIILQDSWSKEFRHIDVNCTTKDVGIRTRLLVSEKFGFSVAEQEALERYLDGLIVLQQLWHPVIYDHATAEMRDAWDHYVRYIDGTDYLPVPGVRI